MHVELGYWNLFKIDTRVLEESTIQRKIVS